MCIFQMDLFSQLVDKLEREYPDLKDLVVILRATEKVKEKKVDDAIALLRSSQTKDNALRMQLLAAHILLSEVRLLLLFLLLSFL